MPPEESQASLSKIKWNEVTWYSKLGALIVFLGIIPALSFYIGTQYQEVRGTVEVPPAEESTTVVASDQLDSSSTEFLAEISSSTSAVGDYQIVVQCENLNPKYIAVLKDEKTYQTLEIHRASVSGTHSCVQAKSEDVNFDGYQDVLVLTGTGSGGSMMSYWLYSSSTQQFSCPKEDNECVFSNPIFDPIAKTITTRHPMGASKVIIEIYEIKDGVPESVKYSEEVR